MGWFGSGSKSEILHVLRRRGLCGVLLLAALMIASTSARADNTADTNTKVIAWAHANLAKYHQYIQYARHGARPQVPVPPMVDPPCHVCGETAETEGERQVDAWLRQSEEPEMTGIQGLLAISRQLAAYRAQRNQLSPAAVNALAQYEDEPSLLADTGLLADRLLNGKAIPMAEKYDREPKQAYAGIQFLLAAGKEAALVQGRSSDEAVAYARNWAQSVVSTIDRDVISGYEYNLCPVYIAIYHQIAMLGGSEQLPANFEQILEKIQQLMTFKVHFDLQVRMPSSDGGHLNAAWTGQAHLRLKVQPNNSCYTPQWEDGGQMSVNVTQWDMVNMRHLPNGGVVPVRTDLSSPRQYTVPLQNAQVSLCDPQAIFQLPLSNLRVPQEKVTVGGHTANAMLLSPFLSTVIGANELNNPATNAATGGAPSMPGAIRASSPASDNAEMEQLKAQIEAHKGDVSWLMSPQGRAVMAKMQKQALAQAQSHMASAGMVMPQSNSFSQLSATVNSAHLHWTNGRRDPVNQTLHFTKDGNSFVLTVTVQQGQ